MTHGYASTKYSQTGKSIELREAPNVNKGYLENALPLNDRGHESGVQHTVNKQDSARKLVVGSAESEARLG